MGPNVPPGYRLEESDPDVLILRRRDGAFVAAFSARGATQEGIREAVEEDRGVLHRGHDGPPGAANDGHRLA